MTHPLEDAQRSELSDKLRSMMQAHMDGIYVFSARNNADELLREIFAYALTCPAEHNGVDEVTASQLICAFRQMVDDIPLGVEDKIHGMSAYNWGRHYLKRLKSLSWDKERLTNLHPTPSQPSAVCVPKESKEEGN